MQNFIHNYFLNGIGMQIMTLILMKLFLDMVSIFGGTVQCVEINGKPLELCELEEILRDVRYALERNKRNPDRKRFYKVE